MAEQNPSLNDLVAQVSGGQNDRVAQIGAGQQPAAMDLISQLVSLNQEQQKLHETDPRTMQDEMSSTPGIAALLASLGAGVAGALTGGEQGEQLLKAGGGFLGGYKQQRGQEVAASNEQLAAETANIDDLINQQRQRLTVLLQAQPEMFVDPNTMEPVVDPRLIGYAATGTLMPINPVANFKLKNRLNTAEQMIALGQEWVMNAESPEQRRRGLTLIGEGLEVNFDDEVYNAVEAGNEQGVLRTVISKGYFTDESVLRAQAKAYEQGGSLLDYVDELVKKDPLEDAEPMTIRQAKAAALQEYAIRLAANPEVHDPSLSFKDQIQILFDTPEDQAMAVLLRDEWVEGVSPEALLADIGSNMDTILKVKQIGGTKEDGALNSILENHDLDVTDPTWEGQLALSMTRGNLHALNATLNAEQSQGVGTIIDEFAVNVAGKKYEGLENASDMAIKGFARWHVIQTRREMLAEAETEETGHRGIVTAHELQAKLGRQLENPERMAGLFNAWKELEPAFDNEED